MRTAATSRGSLVAALVFALSVFCFTLFVWVSFGGSVPFGVKGYRVSVQFGPEASNVFPNTDVRISGVSVGEVTKVKTREGRIDTELELESRYAPLPSDARAIVRSKTLLGEAYIELTPGSRTAKMLPENGRVSASNVQEAQGIDRALSAFDARTRKDLRDFMQGVGEAFEGRGPDASAALGNAPLAVEDLRRLVDVLDRQGNAVQGFVRDTGTALETIAERGADAQTIARAGASVLGATAARDRQLTETIKATPALLRAIRAVTLETVEASEAAAPALRGLRPVAPFVKPALRDTRLLAPDLRAALLALGRTTAASRDGVPALTSVLRVTGPLLRVLDPAGGDIVPLLKALDAYKDDATTAFANTAASMNGFITRPDGTKRHYLRVLSHFSNEMGFGETTRNGTHRENVYPAPGALKDLIGGGTIKAADCREAGNANSPPPFGTGAPPCLQATPYALSGGPVALYPHVPRDTSK